MQPAVGRDSCRAKPNASPRHHHRQAPAPAPVYAIEDASHLASKLKVVGVGARGISAIGRLMGASARWRRQATASAPAAALARARSSCRSTHHSNSTSRQLHAAYSASGTAYRRCRTQLASSTTVPTAAPRRAPPGNNLAPGADFWAIDADMKVLGASEAPHTIQIGSEEDASIPAGELRRLAGSGAHAPVPATAPPAATAGALRLGGGAMQGAAN